MLSVNPDLTIVDLVHDVPPQDVLSGALALEAAFGYFPANTIHVAVVDPGVGSRRRAVAAEARGHLFVGPDNGLLSLALGAAGGGRAVVLEKAEFFRDPVSATFHGRDVFAPVAGHLSLGVPLARLGRAAGGLRAVAVKKPRRLGPRRLSGEVIAVDRFGNLVTNVDGEAIRAVFGTHAVRDVRIAGRSLGPPVRTYAAIPKNGLGALSGSTGRLEVAARDGSAADLLLARRGTRVDLS